MLKKAWNTKKEKLDLYREKLEIEKKKVNVLGDLHTILKEKNI